MLTQEDLWWLLHLQVLYQEGQRHELWRVWRAEAGLGVLHGDMAHSATEQHANDAVVAAVWCL